jgi:stress response protein SCP2
MEFSSGNWRHREQKIEIQMTGRGKPRKSTFSLNVSSVDQDTKMVYVAEATGPTPQSHACQC